jgi:MtrB/PioB family decaheme-associated outer membrane protein
MAHRKAPTFLAFAGALLLLALAPAGAQESKGFSLHLEPIVFGVLETDVDSDSAKFEEYRDMSKGFVIPKLRLRGEGDDGNRYLKFRGDKMLRDDARYALEYGVAGSYHLLVDYNKIPHNFGNKARLLWTRTAPGRYEIADPTQAALQSTLEGQFATNPTRINFFYLDNLITPYIATASEIDVGLQRDRTRMRLDLGKGGAVDWALEYEHENRTGTRALGTSFGFNNVTELPEPIDYDTTDATLGGRWDTKAGGLSFGYKYSAFENNIPTLTWDNPWRSTDSTDSNAYSAPSSSTINGSAVGQFDLAPDNEMSSLFASGRWRFAGDWYAGGSFTWSTMTQDDALLPYGLNSAVRGINFDHSLFDTTNPANLPAGNADNEVEVLNLNADLGTRFGDDISLVFRYRYYDYDNQSKRISFPGYVRFEAVWEDIPRITVPYAYSTEDLGAELGWDVTDGLNLALSYTLKAIDREFREVESSDEDVIKASADWRPTGELTVRGSYEMGDRSIDHYEVEAMEATYLDPAGANNQPGLRKFAQAAREYDAWNVWAQYLLGERWTFSGGVTARDDEYPESDFGLLRDEILQFNFDLSYAVGEGNTLYFFGQVSDREVNQKARQSGGTVSTREIDNWLADFDEDNDTYGLGWTRQLGSRWTLDLKGRYSKSDGTGDFTAYPGGLPLAQVSQPPLPPIVRTEATDFGQCPPGTQSYCVPGANNYEDFELLAAGIKLDYAIGDRVSVGVGYEYEDYTADSFINQGLTYYLPGALLLNGQNGDYEANSFALYFKFSL